MRLKFSFDGQPIRRPRLPDGLSCPEAHTRSSLRPRLTRRTPLLSAPKYPSFPMAKSAKPTSSVDRMATAYTNAGRVIPMENFVRRAELDLHSTLHREFDLWASAAHRFIPGVPSRAVALVDHAEVLFTVLDLHYRSQTDAVWPLLDNRCHDRFQWPKQLMRKDRDQITELKTDFESTLQRCRSHVAASPNDLLDAIDSLTIAVKQHLTHEEVFVVPLIIEHMTDGEFDAIMDVGITNLEPSLQSLLLGMLMYEGDPKIVDRATAALAAAVRRRAAALFISAHERDSEPFDRSSAALRAAIRRRAATDYANHSQRLHGTLEPPVSTQRGSVAWQSEARTSAATM